MSLGERIKQLRKKMNMTQVEFGCFIGVSGATISTTESGKTVPDSQTIELICMKCDVCREWLVDGVERKSDTALTLGERIHLIRKKHNMSMRTFGDVIGISSASIARLESGENNPSEQTIRAICSEFRVNRAWLENGEGDMCVISRPATDLLKDIHSYSNALRLLEEFASMSSEEWLAFKTLLEQFFGHHNLK